MTSRTFITQEQIQTDAEEMSQQTAAIGAARSARGERMAGELARQYGGPLIERIAELSRRRDELAADLQETTHQLLALRKSPQPDFQRGAELTFRAQWLDEQVRQMDPQIAQVNAELAQTVARAAAESVRAQQRAYNEAARRYLAQEQEIMARWQEIRQAKDQELGAMRIDIQQVIDVGDYLRVPLPIDLRLDMQTELYVAVD